MRAAIYLRVSTPDQAEAIPAHEQDCEAFAQKRGWTVVDRFRDVGISASKDVERPGLEQARAAAARGEYEILLVWAYDRLSRREELDGILGICWEFKKNYGVEIESATQETPEDGMLRDMLRLMMTAQANLEARNKSERAKQGSRARVESGLHPGNPPYGYRSDRGRSSGSHSERGQSREIRRIEPHPEEAPIVQRIFREALAGMSQSSIARSLARDGIPTRRGGRWHQGTVSQILKNPAYAGRLRVNGELLDGEHDAIISQTDFDRAQRLMNPHGKRRTQGRDAQDHLLGRLAVCGLCGETLRARRGVRNKNGTRYATYVCPRHSGALASDCPMPPMPRTALDQAVLGHFTQHVLDVEATKAAYARSRDVRLSQLAAERDAAALHYSRAKAQFRRMRDLLADGKIEPEDLDDYRSRRDEANAASNAALDRYNEAKAAQPPDDLEQRVAERLTELAARVRGELTAEGSGDTVAKLRAQLAATFERFEVLPGLYDDSSPWPPGLPRRAFGDVDREILEDALADEDRSLDDRMLDRAEDPERLVWAGDPDRGWTVLPVLREEVVEGLGIGFQPVVRRIALNVAPIGAASGKALASSPNEAGAEDPDLQAGSDRRKDNDGFTR